MFEADRDVLSRYSRQKRFENVVTVQCGVLDFAIPIFTVPTGRPEIVHGVSIELYGVRVRIIVSVCVPYW